MLGVVIAMFGGAFVGLCVGVYLVAERAMVTKDGCAVCGRPWHHMHGDVERSSSVRVLNHLTPIYDQDRDTDVTRQGDPS